MASAVSDKDHCAAYKIHDQRQILLPLADADFVNGEVLELSEF
jgi:hypothetical protein